MKLALKNLLEKVSHTLISEKAKIFIERTILLIAILGFTVHLLIYYLFQFDILSFQSNSELLQSPISAIYTPFSFILVYEVYLLVYYLPHSISTYITKQYEIITLIIIRRLFKDMAQLELTSEWFQIQDDLEFTYDLIASVILFFLLYLFFRQRKKAKEFGERNTSLSSKIKRFIWFKRVMAVALIPTLFGLAIYTLTDWSISLVTTYPNDNTSFKNINNIFFDEFFTILIIIDVILLLVSFFYTNKFYKVIRNTGFIISTILIRLSFSVDGLLNIALIISAIIFGLLILTIHNQFQAYEVQNKSSKGLT